MEYLDIVRNIEEMLKEIKMPIKFHKELKGICEWNLGEWAFDFQIEFRTIQITYVKTQGIFILSEVYDSSSIEYFRSSQLHQIKMFILTYL
jgi:hypothetical protein